MHDLSLNLDVNNNIHPHTKLWPESELWLNYISCQAKYKQTFLWKNFLSYFLYVRTYCAAIKGPLQFPLFLSVSFLTVFSVSAVCQRAVLCLLHCVLSTLGSCALAEWCQGCVGTSTFHSGSKLVLVLAEWQLDIIWVI